MQGRTKHVRAVLASALAATLLAAATPAFGDARTEARAHFKKGMSAIRDGRYDDGVVELQKAYEILPHPNVLYNIARAYAEGGELESAVTYFRRYLESNPQDADEVQKIVDGLEARIAEERAKAKPEPKPGEPAPGGPVTPPVAPPAPTGSPKTPAVTPR